MLSDGNIQFNTIPWIPTTAPTYRTFVLFGSYGWNLMGQTNNLPSSGGLVINFGYTWSVGNCNVNGYCRSPADNYIQDRIYFYAGDCYIIND